MMLGAGGFTLAQGRFDPLACRPPQTPEATTHARWQQRSGGDPGAEAAAASPVGGGNTVVDAQCVRIVARVARKTHKDTGQLRHGRR
jgi:hypothetical protein